MASASVLGVLGPLSKSIHKAIPKDAKDVKANVMTGVLIISRLSGLTLFVASILTTSKQFFGDPIECENHGGVATSMFKAYCFIVGTSIKTAQIKNRTESLHLGEAYRGISSLDYSDGEARYAYYQWVPLVLFLQGFMFYLPYRLWKAMEGGKLTRLLKKVFEDSLTEIGVTDQVKGLSNFLATFPGWYCSSARKIVICETSVFLIAVLQMYLLDILLHGKYFRLGVELLSSNYHWESYRIIEEIFPLVTNCEMNYFGTSGQIVTDSGLCVLSINTLNQKIFIVTWFLHCFIILIAGIKFVLNLLLLSIPSFRYLLLRSMAKKLPSHAVLRMVKSSGFGQYILLVFIAKNIDTVQFTALLSEMSDHISTGSDGYAKDLLPMSVRSETKKFSPLLGKQSESPAILRRPRLISG